MVRPAVAVLLSAVLVIAAGSCSHAVASDNFRRQILCEIARTHEGSRMFVTKSERQAISPVFIRQLLLAFRIVNLHRPPALSPEVPQRKAWQLVASVRAYLAWRAGDAWRPASDRFNPEKLPYTQAINFLNGAQVSAEVCRCCYCSGAPFYGERRPSQSSLPAPPLSLSRKVRA